MNFSRHFLVILLWVAGAASCMANAYPYLLKFQSNAQPSFIDGRYRFGTQLECYALPVHTQLMSTLVAASTVDGVTSYWIETRVHGKGDWRNDWAMQLGPSNLVVVTASHSLNGREYDHGYHTYDRYEVTASGRYKALSNGEYRLLLHSPMPTMDDYSSSNALYIAWPNARYIPNVPKTEPVSMWRKYAPIGLSVAAVLALISGFLLRTRMKK